LEALRLQLRRKKHHLTALNDEMLGRLRDLNFAIVGGKLNAEARRLEAEYDVSEPAGQITIQS